jgi:cation:H+ antiporter
MIPILLPSLALITGIVGLLLGADKFVAGAAAAARNLGISAMVIGLTVVSIGTSAPEIIVSFNAALDGAGELAVGNAIGSNLANIGLVLGITALIAPLPVSRHLLREESPVLLVITALAGLCLYDGVLNRVESVLLALLVIPLLIMVVKYKREQGDDDSSESDSSDDSEIPELSSNAAALWFLGGLVLLLVSARITVWGARELAVIWGISDLVIGLTVVAIGTSLPELAASVVSALRGHHDIAVGNVFGSNLFNLMLVMTTAGAIAPIELSAEVFLRDYLSMALMTVMLVLFVALALRKGGTGKRPALISRPLGAVLLTGYIGYYGVLWITLSTI